MLMGTPSYVSPEQGRGKRVDARADEYSLAVVMYQLAAGRVPFEGSTPMATVLMHIQEPVARPSRYNPNLSPAVEKVILKAMAKDPEERFPTVAAMNQAYQGAVKGSPQTEAEWLHLRGPSEVAVAKQVVRTQVPDEGRSRRSPVVWVLAGLALALAVGGVVGATALCLKAGLSLLAVPPMMGITALFMMLQTLTAIVQALIFSLLATVYLYMMLPHESEGHEQPAHGH